MRADALLARIEKMAGSPPLAQRDFAALEHGADRHRELALAAVAIEQAGTVLRAFDARHVLSGAAAVRAHRTVGPAHRLKGFASFVLVGEDGRLEIGRHGKLL